MPQSQFFVFQEVVAEIHNHRMKAKLKPALEGGQISPFGPNCRDAVPSLKLFFEDVSHALPQMLNCLILAVTFRHQVDRRFSL